MTNFVTKSTTFSTNLATKLLMILTGLSLIGCTSKEEVSFRDVASKPGQEAPLCGAEDVETRKELAVLASPTGEFCEDGEVIRLFIPANRGKNGKGEWVEVDNRTFEPGFRRMDVNFDGEFTREDAQLATKNIYQKQLNSELCPAVADIAQFEGKFRYEPDQFFTSNDVNAWREVAKTGNFPVTDLICLSDCKIINHMDPDFKHQ